MIHIAYHTPTIISAGDMQLSSWEIAETNVFVSTPEKWDSVTRKSNDSNLASVWWKNELFFHSLPAMGCTYYFMVECV